MKKIPSYAGYILAFLAGVTITWFFLESSKEQAHDPTIELSDLVQKFLCPADAECMVEWTRGAESGTPIQWSTTGIEEAPAYYEGFPYYREGSAVVTVNGKITHTVLNKTIVPGRWVVTLLGPRIGITKAIIEMDVNTPKFVEDIPGVLKAAQIKLSPFKCNGKAESVTSRTDVYRMEAPGKKPAWLVEERSCGSAGCSVTLSLLYSSRAAQAVECL